MMFKLNESYEIVDLNGYKIITKKNAYSSNHDIIALNKAGQTIIELLLANKSFEQIVNIICRKFHAKANINEVRVDTQDFLECLVKDGIVTKETSCAPNN